MKIIFTLILSLICINAYADQYNDMEQLVSIQSIDVSNITDISDIIICPDSESAFCDLLLEKENNSDQRISEKKSKEQRMQAVKVNVLTNGGFIFHVADYADGTRIVTALDGGMRGYQGIGINGVQVYWSTNVKWYDNHFIHFYPGGKIVSYLNSQTSIIYK